MPAPDATGQLKFRDPGRARALSAALDRLADRVGRPVTLMHVCGSHEQAIARFGLRAALPRSVDLLMGPGCPVCVTDLPEIDEAVALALQGKVVATYGDMLRVPGTRQSLGDAQAEGARVEVVYGVEQAIALAGRCADQVVFFASGFETTAVTTAAAVLAGLPENLSILSAHKYVPPAMEIVAQIPQSKVEGFLAAGHAAAITGWGLFEPFAARHRLPVVVAGFEPLDILAALLRLLELVAEQRAEVVNLYPRCVTREGNRNALATLWKVFEATGGRWRGIAEIPDGNLRLRPEWAGIDARRRFQIDVSHLQRAGVAPLTDQCICGAIMSGLATPADCPLFGGACTPDSPVGACMVSSEGTCRIWQHYGGRPDIGKVG
jgi:hydrogenase expression/formation protein HypD